MINNDRTKILCWTSLICWILGHITLFLVDRFEATLQSPYSDYVVPVMGMLLVAGVILVIVARVKSPRNKFAKTLFIIYVVEVVIIITLIILFLVACELSLRSCESNFIGCLEMG